MCGHPVGRFKAAVDQFWVDVEPVLLGGDRGVPDVGGGGGVVANDTTGQPQAGLAARG